MKFLTRGLYDGSSQELTEDFDVVWRAACDAYAAHLEQLRPGLPPDLRAFADTTLHDGVVRAVERPSPSELVLTVDAARNPWGPTGVFRLHFTGVREFDGATPDLVGDEWLYDEVHPHPAAAFEYRVLFWKHDFRVAADDLHVRQV
ncbi:MAG TPA: DUF4085 family protein [Tepidisphaeraceae bacterium]|nr:DUF4085 family protein [Tepidisphaeraceae bacterium]